MEYLSKTKPFPHQAAELEQHGCSEFRGYFWEQGCGKTKPVIDETAALFREGKINGLVVVAPNGVHQNWVDEEIPDHMDPAVEEQTRCHIWFSNDTKKHRESFATTLAHPGLAVLVMSYDAVRTEKGRKAWKKFLTDRNCVYVLDESQRVKDPNSKITKRILGSASAKVAPYRRCLSGTPVTNSPFDIYSQLKFLKPNIWKDMGIRNFTVFKSYFGIFESYVNGETGKSFTTCVAYRNLEILYEKMQEVGSRVTKDEVLPHLPKKSYSKRFFDLSPEQKKAYKSIKDNHFVETDAGELTVELVITRLLRYQQIACGYLPESDENNKLVPIEGTNRRLNLLVETCEDFPPDHSAMIWSRFTEDIRLIENHPFFKGKIVKVDGSVTGPARAEALESYRSGEFQFLVANQAAISTGVTLVNTKTMIYYANSFKLEERLQSEDRGHRIGLKHPIHYIDLVANGTVDNRIIKALRAKIDVASQITGDELKAWI